MLERDERGLRARGDAQLVVDRADRVLDRARRHDEFARDGSVVESLREQAENFDFARGEGQGGRGVGGVAYGALDDVLRDLD